MKYCNIAIDGPAGAGKSSIAKGLADKLNYIYVDTGAMYRGLALHFLNNNIPPDDEAKVSQACSKAEINILHRDGRQIILLNGVDVSEKIREEAIGEIASLTSTYPKVREKLLELQRNLAKTANVIMDGRDIGTRILPNADLKIYLTATSKERARRRWAQLLDSGVKSDIDQIEKDIIKRDQRDMNRSIAPLKKADDAILIDSSDMSIEKVLQVIIAYFEKVC